MFSRFPNFDPATSFSIQQDGLIISSMAPFAQCLVTNRIAVVRCSLEYILDIGMQQQYANINEFSFELLFISIDETRENFATQDREIVKSYLDEDCRRIIMQIVLNLMEQLLIVFSPMFIYRVTKTRNIIQKALVKHQLITDKLNQLGYEILECDFDPIGRAFWVMGNSAN